MQGRLFGGAFEFDLLAVMIPPHVSAFYEVQRVAMEFLPVSGIKDDAVGRPLRGFFDFAVGDGRDHAPPSVVDLHDIILPECGVWQVSDELPRQLDEVVARKRS
ncbi:hypothetical protein D3C87_1982120 [compost metagenome]